MPLRSFRFLLSGYPHYYGLIRLPSLWWFFHGVTVSHVHAQPSPDTQHHITPNSPCCAIFRFFQQDGRFVSSNYKCKFSVNKNAHFLASLITDFLHSYLPFFVTKLLFTSIFPENCSSVIEPKRFPGQFNYLTVI